MKDFAGTGLGFGFLDDIFMDVFKANKLISFLAEIIWARNKIQIAVKAINRGSIAIRKSAT
jgi:hypothetical protein